MKNRSNNKLVVGCLGTKSNLAKMFIKQYKKEVIFKFKKKFKVIGVNGFKEMDHYGKKLNLDYIYVQKGGQKDQNVSNNINLFLLKKIGINIINKEYPKKKIGLFLRMFLRN